MDTFDLFTRYSRAIVSGKLKRNELTSGTSKILSRNRLRQLEVICFNNYSYSFYEKIDKILQRKGL